MAYNRERDDRLTFDLPKPISKLIKKEAKKEDRSVAYILRRIVISWADKK